MSGKIFEFGSIRLSRLKTGALEENCYLLQAPSGDGVLVDPGDDAGLILNMVKTSNAKPSAIILTHAHFDHVGAVQAVREALEIPVYLHSDAVTQYDNAASIAARWGLSVSQPAPVDHLLDAGKIMLGGLELEALFAPGHAPGHLAFYAPGFVISGDALFRGSIGRTDIPGGDHALLLERIRSQLLTLPPETLVFPGHGGETTIDIEAQSNPFL